ncbi:MAG: hypothetical protein ACKVQU_06930 [Burkholderiales bacterium]
MKSTSLHAACFRRNEGTTPTGAAIAMAVAMLVASPVVSYAADSPGGAAKTPGVKFETIPGSSAKRVMLSQKAAERLGIATGKVSMEVVTKKQMVSGIVTPPLGGLTEPKPTGGGFGGFGQLPVDATAAIPGFGGLQSVSSATPVAKQPDVAKSVVPLGGDAWVAVSLSKREWERLDKDKPARILPIGTRDQAVQNTVAKPSGVPPVEDVRRSMLTVYYVVPGKDHGLALNKRMRVELPMTGIEEKQKVIPYSALYYDAKGVAWTYVNTKPLVYERQRITVERIAGDLAVLSDGPDVDTPIVTVGAALLYGTEVFGK